MKIVPWIKWNFSKWFNIAVMIFFATLRFPQKTRAYLFFLVTYTIKMKVPLSMLFPIKCHSWSEGKFEYLDNFLQKCLKSWKLNVKFTNTILWFQNYFKTYTKSLFCISNIQIIDLSEIQVSFKFRIKLLCLMTFNNIRWRRNLKRGKVSRH